MHFLFIFFVSLSKTKKDFEHDLHQIWTFMPWSRPDVYSTAVLPL